jgi:hypothetical protein
VIRNWNPSLPITKKALGIQVESDRRLGVELAFNHAIGLGGAVISDCDPSNCSHLCAEASGKPMLTQYIRNLRDKARMAYVVRMEKKFERQALEHIAVLQAVADKSSDEARLAMSLHIDRVRERFMRWLFAD